ncbi:MAG: LemA family protein [Erysipelotrichaceae bacterium]|nr:LemA family protein [Erysipelotrichaceae bacterium]
MIIVVGIIILIIIILVGYLITSYNKFVQMKNKVEESFSTMDVYLKKRYDLIPNLVAVVKGYAKHESETLEKVISARNLAVKSQGLEEKMTSELNFQSMLGPLYAISEQYPDLKANVNFMTLQSELKSIESEIANSRKYYNAVVVKFNNLVEMFPTNIIANCFGYQKKPLYEIVDDVQRENVRISFD